MWPWGHVAAGYLLFALYARWRGEEPPGDVAVLIVVFGSLFPDLVDKPLAWYAGVLPTGRTLAHSLIVLVPLCTIVYLYARHRGHREWGVAFGIGALSHALIDALPALWRPDATATFLVYPLIAVETYEEGPPTVMGLLLASLGDPYFWFEFVLLAAALVVWREHGYPGVGPVRAAVGRVR